MSISFPMTVCLTVTDVGTTDEVLSEGATVSASRSLSLTLQARKDTEISLSNGQPLASTPLYLTLFSGKDRATTLAPELDEGTVGFLIQTSDSNGEPFVHGSIAWPEDTLPYYMLDQNASRSVWLSLASIETIQAGTPSFPWKQGRENIIAIASLRLASHAPKE